MEIALASAAAQAVISAVIDPLMKKVYKSIETTIQNREDANLVEEIDALASRLTRIRGFLQDAEEKQSKNAAVRDWLANLEDSVYDAEDLLDDYTVATDVQVMEKISTNKVRQLFCCFVSDKIEEHRKNLRKDEFKKRLCVITTTLNNIIKEQKYLGLQFLGEYAAFSAGSTFQRPQTISYIDDIDNIIGRNDIKCYIINKLLGHDDLLETPYNEKRSFFILPIVGIGGIGKTTLAKLVYNDELIQNHFDVRIWISVSNEFDVDNLRQKIMLSGIKHDGGYENNMSTLDSLQINFRQCMEGKRYFLVLDDALEDKSHLWELLLESLSVGIGSRVLVTTRSLAVANAVVNHMRPITLNGMSDGDIWEVFKKHAFRNFDSSNYALHPHFEVIGKQILKRLKGSPLPAKSIGSLLNTHPNLKYWRDMLRTDFLGDVNDDMLSIVHISYQNLHPNLKQCFAFCSLFPQGYQFQETWLVKLWISEGFIPEEGSMRVEDVGRRYFSELRGRSFFELAPNRSTFYLMHELIHEFGKSISSRTHKWMHKTNFRNDQCKMIRHISCHGDSIDVKMLKDICNYEKSRTLIITSTKLRDSVPITVDVLDRWFRRLNYLRVLTLSGCRMMALPDSIGNLKHMQYLDLSDTMIEQVPITIGLCHKLELLNLQYCDRLTELPNNISGLVNLKDLNISSSLMSSLDGIGRMTSLQELRVFPVGKREGKNVEELKFLNQLQQILTICSLENVETKEEAKNAELHKKEYLNGLKLVWSIRQDNVDHTKEEDVLESLRPQTYLKILHICMNQGCKPPSWLNNDDMPCLEEINFEHCNNWEFFPPLGTFITLKLITLRGLKNLKRIDHQFYGSNMTICFPYLEVLNVQDNDNLEEWEESGRQQCFPKLHSLNILRCPKLRKIPPLPLNSEDARNLRILKIRECLEMTSIGEGILGKKLETLQISGCPKLLIEYPIELGSTELLLSLQNIRIINCPKIIPSYLLRGVSSSLERLYIMGFHGHDEMLMKSSLLGSLSKLVELSLKDCPNLAPSPEEREKNDDFPLGALISLKVLRIKKCPNMLPWLCSCSSTRTTTNDRQDNRPSIPHIVKLIIDDKNIDDGRLHTLLLHESFSSLKELIISNCMNIKSLPEHVLSHLPSLFKLKISNCLDLTYMGGFHELALKILEINSCPNLMVSSSTGIQVDLRGLLVENCNVQLLTRLLLQCNIKWCLEIRCMIGLASFDGELEEGLLRQSSTTFLELYGCPDLMCLPTKIGRLASLCRLCIKKCPKMQHLPDDLHEFTSLRTLEIEDCPELKKLYSREEGGPNWDTTAHIRHVHFH